MKYCRWSRIFFAPSQIIKNSKKWMKKYFGSQIQISPNKNDKNGKTYREKVESSDGFPCCRMKDSQTPDLAGSLPEAPGVKKFQRWKEEVLLDVIDGIVGVVPG